MTTQLDEIPFVDVTVRLESLQDDLFRVAQAISPTVRREEVTFEELQGGYVNSIYKLSGLEVSPGVKKSVVFRTFDVKFNAEGFMKLYVKSEDKSKGENGADTEIAGKANGHKSNGHKKETKENVVSNGHKKEENGISNGRKKEEDGISNGHKKEENGIRNGHKKEENVVSNGHKEEENGISNGHKKEENGENEKSGKEKPSSLFSRLTEYLIMNEVSKHGLCQPVYAKYQNGICYYYAEGTTVTGALMNSEEYLQEAASKLARFHSIKYEIPNLQFKTRYDRSTDELRAIYYENLVKMEQQIAEIKESPFSKIPKLRVLIEYEKRINTTLKQIGLGKIGFCHNDPNQKNLIWNSQAAPGARLGFIDLEMTMPNYVIFDLAYHWGCFGGHLLVDFDGSFFPSSDYRRRFLRKYLQEFNKAEQIELSTEEFDSELEDLFHRASLATIGHILKWCIFGHVFHVEKDLLKNVESIAAREKDEHFCAKYALSLYRTFSSLYPQVLEDAVEHFEKKSV